MAGTGDPACGLVALRCGGNCRARFACHPNRKDRAGAVGKDTERKAATRNLKPTDNIKVLTGPLEVPMKTKIIHAESGSKNRFSVTRLFGVVRLHSFGGGDKNPQHLYGQYAGFLPGL